MIVLKSDNSVHCDVDDTIAMWNPTPEQSEKYGIEITCPGGLYQNDRGEIKMGPSWTQRIVPHFTHVEQLKKHKARGHFVCVWSAGGWEWAQAAVKALGLEQYVDLVISKPRWTYDDLQAEQFMPKSQYMENVFPQVLDNSSIVTPEMALNSYRETKDE